MGKRCFKKDDDNFGQIFIRKSSFEPMAQMNQNCFSNFKYQIANLSGSFIWLEKLPGFYFTYIFSFGSISYLSFSKTFIQFHEYLIRIKF